MIIDIIKINDGKEPSHHIHAKIDQVSLYSLSHISKCKKNQEEIFNSLNKNDFKKILTNLDDEHISNHTTYSALRKTSLKLLGELLWANTPLKRTFCNIMEINLLPGNVQHN